MSKITINGKGIDTNKLHASHITTGSYFTGTLEDKGEDGRNKLFLVTGQNIVAVAQPRHTWDFNVVVLDYEEVDIDIIYRSLTCVPC